MLELLQKINAFSEAVKLSINTLATGKLVRMATIYGITVAAHKHEFAQLQKLQIDFERSCCCCKNSTICYFVE